MASPSSTFILSREKKTPVNNVITVRGVGGVRTARSHTNHAQSVIDQERCVTGGWMC
jgi:hypothetical protein